jgi:hypothetical protein
MWNRCKTKGPYYMPLNSVLDPHHVDAVPDEDPDPTYHFEADPDSDLYLMRIPDPTFYLMCIRVRILLFARIRIGPKW